MTTSQTRSMRFITGLAAAFILASGTSAATAANLVGNGGFETQGAGGTGDSALWNEFGTDAVSGTVSERSSTNPASGSWAHHLNAFGSAAVGGHTAGINLNTVNVNGLSLLPGSTLSLSFDADVTFNGVGDIGFYQLHVLNGIGQIVATTGLQALSPTTGYQEFSTADLIVPSFGLDPNDTYYAFAEITANAGATEQGSNPDIWVDNVVIDGSEIPEPASLALAGLGSLLLLTRRR